MSVSVSVVPCPEHLSGLATGRARMRHGGDGGCWCPWCKVGVEMGLLKTLEWSREDVQSKHSWSPRPACQSEAIAKVGSSDKVVIEAASGRRTGQ